jgi:hypothetical protein
LGARYRALAGARARSVAAPIANRELQKSTGGGRKCSQLFPVEREGSGVKMSVWCVLKATFGDGDHSASDF